MVELVGRLVGCSLVVVGWWLVGWSVGRMGSCHGKPSHAAWRPQTPCGPHESHHTPNKPTTQQTTQRNKKATEAKHEDQQQHTPNTKQNKSATQSRSTQHQKHNKTNTRREKPNSPETKQQHSHARTRGRGSQDEAIGHDQCRRFLRCPLANLVPLVTCSEWLLVARGRSLLILFMRL